MGLSELMLIENPRKRRKSRSKSVSRPSRRRRRRNISLSSIPARRRRNYSIRGMSGILGQALPIGAGVAAGLTLPLILKQTGMIKYLVPVGGALLLNMLPLGGMAKKVSAGMLIASGLMLVNSFVLSKLPTGSVLNPTLADDDTSIIPLEMNMGDIETPSISADGDIEVISDNGDDSMEADNDFNRF